jgi:chromosome segregation ATPase
MKKGFNVKGAILRTVMVLAITAAIGFGLAGCGEEMAQLEEKQLGLQAQIGTNARQITALSERIEQNQQQLSAGLEEVQNYIRDVAANTTAVGKEQARLQKAMQNSNQQTTNKIILLEQSRNELQAGIEEVRDSTQNIVADMGTDIANVKDEQARLYETVQSNSQQFANNLAVIEQNQQQWQSKVEELQQNFQEVTIQISTIGNDLSKLQEVLQSNIRELAGMMDLSSKEQLKFQEKIQQNLLAVDSSVSAIKQSQQKLQSQIENVRSSAEIMSTELPAAIEQLREEMERNRSTENEGDQPPPDTNTVE